MTLLPCKRVSPLILHVVTSGKVSTGTRGKESTGGRVLGVEKIPLVQLKSFHASSEKSCKTARRSLCSLKQCEVKNSRIPPSGIHWARPKGTTKAIRFAHQGKRRGEGKDRPTQHNHLSPLGVSPLRMPEAKAMMAADVTCGICRTRLFSRNFFGSSRRSKRLAQLRLVTSAFSLPILPISAFQNVKVLEHRPVLAETTSLSRFFVPRLGRKLAESGSNRGRSLAFYRCAEGVPFADRPTGAGSPLAGVIDPRLIWSARAACVSGQI